MSFFRAVTAATQAISNLVETELVFGTELSDPDSVFASNHFTVPSGWNGRVGGLSAGFYTTTGETKLSLRIQKQTGGVGAWVTIAEGGFAARGVGQISAGPIVFATGDKYRVAYYGTTTTKANDIVNFFSGFVFPSSISKLGMFRGQRSTTDQFMTANGVRVALFETELVDSHSFLTPATGIVTVPSAFNGGYLQLTAGFHAAADAPVLYIQRSTDSGTTWTTIARTHIQSGGINGTLASGSIAAVTGDQYRFAASVPGSNFTFMNDPRSFFAGIFYL